jgi:hypothetical protein
MGQNIVVLWREMFIAIRHMWCLDWHRTEETTGNWDLIEDIEEEVLKSFYKLSHISKFWFDVLLSRFNYFCTLQLKSYIMGKVKNWIFIIYFMFKQWWELKMINLL